MAYFLNDDGTIKLSIQLINNEFTDIVKNRSDYENYLPFNFSLEVGDQIFTIPGQPTLTMYEAKKMLSSFEQILAEKMNDQDIKEYQFSSSEAYFEISIYDTYEKGELYTDLWINLGSLTNGKISGYQLGYRFIVRTTALKKFCLQFREELHSFF
jgi:hypothetical protein